VDDLRESPAAEVVRLLQKEGARVKVWEPFKPGAQINGIDMAVSLDSALQDADAILLLVRHTEFTHFNAREIAAKTRAKTVLDCVSGWDAPLWRDAGFTVHRLGVNKPGLVG
jgi:UDP-N-acetyl-D-mannosaminuronate dehydrogenase